MTRHADGAPHELPAALYFLFAGKDAARAKQFYYGLAMGQELTSTNPVYTVREKLLKEKVPMHHSTVVHRAALLILAWNGKRQWRACPPGLTWRGAVDKDTAFPAAV